MAKQTFSTDFAGKKLIIEVGELALQANASCTVRYGDTVVLATATMGGIREGMDYFPLSVEYEERLYAAGKIKGSRWVKREGRPSDEAILAGRLIDRAIRPLFPKGMRNEVQVILTVLSFDGENDSDILGLIGASAVLSMSSIPWDGPIGSLRMGKTGDKWMINPTFEERELSELDYIIAGKDGKLLMLEAESKEVSEEVAYTAIEKALTEMNPIIKLIEEVKKTVGKEKEMPQQQVQAEEDDDATKEAMEKASAWIAENVANTMFAKPLTTKEMRKTLQAQVTKELDEYLEAQGIGKDRRKKALALIPPAIEQAVVRLILEEDRRVDGRKLNEIRPLNASVGVLPRTHGSGLFNRGETQVLSIVTLGAPGDVQFLEGLEESSKKGYMHHYNFPPYSVGETGRMAGPGRREIGHGALAEKAVKNLIPDKEEFPYTIRVVSEVLGSNGSSSMASVCGSSLALMDAGVPLKKPIAGIAMGLASDEEKGIYKVLTDLQDLEDGNGGMDFKIAGTSDGVTAIQLDTKTKGIPLDTVKQTFEQGKIARMEILEVMNRAISASRSDLSAYAPRIISFMINPDKIREVIGPGGKVINKIIDETGVQIDIEDSGLVLITAANPEKGQQAADWIQNITKEVEPGQVYEGRVSRMFEFGAMVEILPGQEGMVHVSELAHRRVAKVSDVVKLGDIVKVKVINIDEKGRINLSMKALLPRPEGSSEGFTKQKKF